MKYKINKGFIIQKVGNKQTIFDGEESALYTFNKTGSIIFEKLKLGWDRDKIVNFLSNMYSIKIDEAEADFEEFINELIKSKIIKKL